MPGCPVKVGCPRDAGHQLLEWRLEERMLCEVSFWDGVDSGNATAAAKAADNVAGS